MSSTEDRTNDSEFIALAEQISSQINKDRIEDIIGRAKCLNIEDKQLVVNCLGRALVKGHHLLENADCILRLLSEVATSAHIIALDRTISSKYITPDPEQFPGVYRILCEPPAHVRVLRRGKKDITVAFNEGMVSWAHLSHPNILPIYGALFEGSDGPISMVSLRVTNGNIADYTKTFSQTARMPLAFDVINGLCYLHGLDIVHGTLQPENILISHDGRALIMHNPPKANDSDLSSARYCAPEMMYEDDPRPRMQTDIWALGCIIYEVISGRLPFRDLRLVVTVVVAIATGKKPFRPNSEEGGNGVEEDIDKVIWQPVSSCWEFKYEDRPTCLQLRKVFSSITVQDNRPLPTPIIQPEAFEHSRDSVLNLDAARSILTRVLATTVDSPVQA